MKTSPACFTLSSSFIAWACVYLVQHMDLRRNIDFLKKYFARTMSCYNRYGIINYFRTWRWKSLTGMEVEVREKIFGLSFRQKNVSFILIWKSPTKFSAPSPNLNPQHFWMTIYHILWKYLQERKCSWSWTSSLH